MNFIWYVLRHDVPAAMPTTLVFLHDLGPRLTPLVTSASDFPSYEISPTRTHLPDGSLPLRATATTCLDSSLRDIPNKGAIPRQREQALHFEPISQAGGGASEPIGGKISKKLPTI